MYKEVILAGFGGQGIMFMGMMLAYAGMLEGKEVSWIPSYGPEMRGGTANCSVCVSDTPVSCPIVSEPDILVVMNQPSLDKFESSVKPGGCIYLSFEMTNRPIKRKDVTYYNIAANEAAASLGSAKSANMVMLGALMREKIVNPLSVSKALEKAAGPGKKTFLEANLRAVQTGIDLGKDLSVEKRGDDLYGKNTDSGYQPRFHVNQAGCLCK